MFESSQDPQVESQEAVPAVQSDEHPPVIEPEILASRELARAALAEITDPAAIGADAGHEFVAPGVGILFFTCSLPGYPGWRWAAALAKAAEGEPVTVLEVELLPGDEALVAPEWIPWSERLKQYRETQARLASEEAQAAEAAVEDLGDDEDDDEDDLLDNDHSDYDDELDGVDVDSLDPEQFDGTGEHDHPDEFDDDEFDDVDEEDFGGFDADGETDGR